MSTTSHPRFNWPKLHGVRLHAFSLYSRDPDVSLAVRSGVTCLAGANGIGKSTFLGTVNFALTGAVPEPKREFLSAATYFQKAKDYTRSFFDGRIAELDRDAAAVSVEFSVRGRTYLIKRALFSIGALEELQISQDGAVVHSADGATADENEQHYRKDLCQTIGLNSFDQFVMLQHFLFTFDESRHLVFWDREVSSALLHVCFGGDPQEASRADWLNREMDKAGSRGRNYQFQANNISKRIETLEASIKAGTDNTTDGEQAQAQYESLTMAAERAVIERDEAERLVNDAELKVMSAHAEVISLRGAYAKAFEQFMTGKSAPQRHPLVSSAIADCRCPVCQNEGVHIARAIQAKLQATQCPLCSSSIAATNATPASNAELTRLDVALATAKRGLDEAIAAKTRLGEVLSTCRDAALSTRSALEDFERANYAALEVVRGKMALLDGPLAKSLESFRETRNDFQKQRDEAYRDRDKHKLELRGLQRKLEQRYLQAEASFVPLFKDLAQSFLGMDLDITLVTGGPSGEGVGAQLQVDIRGNARRKESQLSESQRFFIDIALRMALSQHISNDDALATLFIDTPEGSLDIAYEKRAGQMFADFVESGHDLLMTANINSSRLLKTLAQACKASKMKIVQMTHWTELSDVQQASSDLFAEAFEDIEQALNS
jgi:energy-coupling factor transporter ATP-binding protein EcfA2